MGFDTTKYKDWYWCESSGLYNDYFREIEGVEELPIEFAKEVIDDCDGIIELLNKPNHYHKCYNGHEFFFEYVIYAFKNKSAFQKVVKEFEDYFDIQKTFDIFKITENDFLSFSKEKEISDNFNKCAHCLANYIIDADEDFGIARIPKTFKKYLKKCVEIFQYTKEYSSVMRCSRRLIKNKSLFSYRNFKNNKKNFYV